MTGVWIATSAWADSPNETGTDILGVFTSEEAAQRCARMAAPHTGCVMHFTLDACPDDPPAPR
jgi:hypothetical protein